MVEESGFTRECGNTGALGFLSVCHIFRQKNDCWNFWRSLPTNRRPGDLQMAVVPLSGLSDPLW